jgi:hypothetical protein
MRAVQARMGTVAQAKDAGRALGTPMPAPRELASYAQELRATAGE